MRYFFFGTLMDPDVSELVLGRILAPRQTRSARLEGYRRVLAVEEPLPVLQAAAGEHVSGIIVEGLTEDDRARIAFFEGSDYVVEALPVRLENGEPVEARVHLASNLDVFEETPWDFARWRADHKPKFLALSKLWMTYFGCEDLTEADAAWDRLAAQLDAPARKTGS
ncbi:MAG: gamma-glutamylcyclotransferase family protein [Gammaproteobacteria bacterium]